MTDQVNLHQAADLFRRHRPCRLNVRRSAYVAELDRSFEADLIFKQSASRRGFGVYRFVCPATVVCTLRYLSLASVLCYVPTTISLSFSLSLPLTSFSTASLPSCFSVAPHAYSNLGVASESGP